MDATTLPATPFRRADIGELGLTPKRLRHLIDSGAVRRLLRGAYLRADVELTTEIRAQAAALSIEEHHVICDRTAAWLHGVDVLTAEELVAPPPVETCTLPGRSATKRQELDGHVRDLQPSDIMVVSGVRVTTPMRTALDLGCLLRRREAYAALNAFARHHGLRREALLAQALRYGGRRGVVQLRALIPLIDRRLESQRESWTLLEIRDAGLPVPEAQFWIEIDGVPTYRLDLAYPAHRVAIEYDGEEWHDRTEGQRERDDERRGWLRDHGWTVIVIRKGAFTGVALDRWIDELRRALQPTYSNKRW